MKNKILDYLGNPIDIGERGLRVHSYGHSKEFKKVTIVDINETRPYGDIIGFITDGNDKPGWTFPERILCSKSITVKI